MSGTMYPARRSVSQIVRRHTPGSLLYFDDQELVGEIVRVDGRADNRVDPDRLIQHLHRFLDNWREQGGQLVGFYEIDNLRPQDLDVRRPTQVYWEPLSTWYQCSRRDCRIVHDLRTFDKNVDGRCRECSSPLTQFPYIFYHKCGAMQQLRPTKQDHCKDHGVQFLFFRDTRNLSTSQWVCLKDGNASNAFYPVCGNAACRAQSKAQGDPHIRYSISYWREPWAYYTQKVDYVNLDEARAKEFIETGRGRALLHEATIGQRPAGRERLHYALMTAGGACPACGTGLPAEAAFCHRCGRPIPDTARERLDDEIVSLPLNAYDGRVAWAILRDLTESTSLAATVAEQGVTVSQVVGLRELRSVGLHDIVLVKAFPLTTASFGYTRERPGPEAWLNAFPRPETDARIPVFTNTTTTEGWLVQLRGDAVVEWLRANAIGALDGELPPAGTSELQAKDWLVRRIVEGNEVITAAVRGLVHTYSHAMLRSVAYVCGLEASSLGELVWTDALAFAVYAGETELGALSATFDQATDRFRELLEEYAACIFDPTCSVDERGACVGCLHLTRGCERFNSDLSRAYLIGGPTDEGSPLGDNAIGYFSVLREPALA